MSGFDGSKREQTDAAQKEPRQESKELDRIIFFSDAIFAIAMTLLVVDIQTPDIPTAQVAEELPGRLLELWPKIFSYVISFLVVGVYWMAHHRMFRYVRRYDERLMWLNIVFLMFVAFLPFPTSVLGEYGDQQIVVIFYAGSLAAIGFMSSLLWIYTSSGHRLVDSDLDPHLIRGATLRSLTPPVIFLFSIVISFISVSGATYSWLLIALIQPIVSRIHRFRLMESDKAR